MMTMQAAPEETLEVWDCTYVFEDTVFKSCGDECWIALTRCKTKSSKLDRGKVALKASPKTADLWIEKGRRKMPQTLKRRVADARWGKRRRAR